MEKIKLSKKTNLTIEDSFLLFIRKCKVKNLSDLFIKSYEQKITPFFEFDEEKEWRMIREAEYQYDVEDGRIAGFAEGRAEGEIFLGTLITKLCSGGRTSDVELAAKDEEARKRLYKEFGMIEK